jgi:hypothetical protein
MPLSRRGFLGALFAAPAIIRIPGLLMPVKAAPLIMVPAAIIKPPHLIAFGVPWDEIDQYVFDENMRLVRADPAPTPDPYDVRPLRFR